MESRTLRWPNHISSKQVFRYEEPANTAGSLHGLYTLRLIDLPVRAVELLAVKVPR